ncbi:hypothetical protein [Curtobacterium sp. 458]|uniref:hypothetical protein n=1 Tax=Curtobacterium sp. 458 TaxID=3050069 RepID=UPI0025B36E3C|nr:hypothetical protein [Curtobacterium sp. 458]WJY01500.1 hypothetical protein QPJ90_07305 [Curtobacterium sp. 458]
MRKQYLTITTAVLAVTLLAGCSGGGDSGGGDAGSGAESSSAASTKPTQAAPAQSKQEACTLVENELQSYIASQSSAAAGATSAEDRAKVVEGLTSRLDAVVPKVTNDEVKQDFEAFSSAAKDYVKTVQDSGSQTSSEAVAAQEKVQATLKDLSADCPS